MSEATRTRRRGAGRAARVAQREAVAPSPAIWPGIEGGKFQPLTRKDMERVHDAALTILDISPVPANQDIAGQLDLP